MDFPDDQTQIFGGQLDGGPNQEDWEDWLRWEPAAEPISPEDTFNSGSSKNDSPLQEPAYPVGAIAYGKTDTDTLLPPLIVDEDALGFTGGESATDTPLVFGLPASGQSGFDFVQSANFENLPPNVPRLDTNFESWAGRSNAVAEPSQTLTTLPTEHNHQLPSASSYTATTPSLHHSPESSSGKRSSLDSKSAVTPPPKRGGRKRKADVQQEPSPEEVENGDSQDGDEPPVKKTSHNVIEKRYRNNLNDKIVELRNSVPSLRATGRLHGGEGTEDLGGLTPAHKLNKATVMAKATEYIRHLEKRNTAMADEMDTLKARLAAVEAAIGRSRDRHVDLGESPLFSVVQSREVSLGSQNGSPPFANMPQDQTRYRQSIVQQQYMQQQTQPAYARPPNPPVDAQNQPQYAPGRGAVMNKVMLGTMAGLMAMEGFTEQQNSSEHPLFAIPTALFKRGTGESLDSSFNSLGRRVAAVSLLKVVLIIGCLLYLLLPLLSFSPRRKQRAGTALRLPQVPSLASPVEVRRKAWLTAIQTVWVPKHFLLEVAAVCSKMIQLSVRRVIGSEAFTHVTGTTKEEEAARIKAWDIAIDAQLAGGDAEVSYYRLLLTLMESGTLPDSPARLMQKAVHFRVFFWEIANAGYGNLIGFKLFTEKVGKIYWDSARKLQKELVHAQAQGRPFPDDETELLPDHLARLGELDCEEVLSDEMIQRAWNLAWNKPSAYRTAANEARDSVIEDHAIRSPLDAVAAWYTNTLVDETLEDALGESPSTFDTEYYIGLALSVAPPASNTQVRALAAKAVLSNSNRDSNIIATLEALPVVSPPGGMNLVNHTPASPDMCAALTVAKVISLCSPSAPDAARARGMEATANLHLAPRQYTLLLAVAVYRLLRLLSHDTRRSSATEYAMEELAAGLRVWVGTSDGAHHGLGHEGRGRLVTLCLSIAKQIGGWDDRDSGYGSESPVTKAVLVTC